MGLWTLTSPEWFDFPKDKLYTTYAWRQGFPNRWTMLGVDQESPSPNRTTSQESVRGLLDQTEIFFDRGSLWPENIGLRLLAEILKTTVTSRIWNIVLSQFNMTLLFLVAEYRNCPHKNIDTGQVGTFGMNYQGLKQTLKQTLLMPIIREVEKMSEVKPMIQMAITWASRWLLTTSVRFHLQWRWGSSC